MIPASSIYLYGDDALTSLRADPKKAPAKKTTYTGRPNPNAIRDLGVKLRDIKPIQVPAALLRSTPIAPAVEPGETAEHEAQESSPTKSVEPVTLELNKKDGVTTSVTIRKGDTVRVVNIKTIDEDES